MKVIDTDTKVKRSSKGRREKRPPSPAKQRRIDKQRQAEETNRRLRAAGLPTAWEEAKADRKARRAKMRAEGTLVQQKRENGRIVKFDDDGNKVLVECCPRCTAAGHIKTAHLDDRKGGKQGAAKVHNAKKPRKSKPKTIKAPRQITPKEGS